MEAILLTMLLQEAPAKLLFKAADAHALALADIALVQPQDRPYTKYLWISSGDALDAKVVAWGLNWLGNMPPWRPPVVGGGKLPMLVRVDIRRFAATDADQRRWLRTWEEFTFDPNFSLLFTHDSIKLLLENGLERPKWLLKLDAPTKKMLISVPPYKDKDGKEWKEKWVSVFRQPQLALDPTTLGALERATNSTAPVVEADYFLNRAMKSIRGGFIPNAADDEVFKTIFGGLYYDFAGIRTAKEAGKKKATDLDQLFEDLGIIDDADGSVNAFTKLDRLGSEQRLAMLRSDVTGKTRLVLIMPTLRSVRVRGVVTITMDVKDNNIDILSNVFMNLLAFFGDALEVIFNDVNGGQKYALFNKQGKRQDEVPPDIANDSTIPHPYTQRLDTMACPICHAKAHNGWQPLRNNAAAGLASLVGDISNKKRFTDETINLINSKYRGNADNLLAELRRGSIGAVLEMTGPWPVDNDNKDQTGVFRLTAARLGQIRDRYWHEEVDAAKMLRSLGYDSGQEKPVDWLTKLLPFEEGAPEDVRIKQLLQGESIPRVQAELARGFLAGRIQQALILQRKEGRP